MVFPSSSFTALSHHIRRHSTSVAHAQVVFLRRLHDDPLDLHFVESTHSMFLKSGHYAQTVSGNHLLNGYVRYGAMDSARKLFDEMCRTRNVVTWTSLMAGFVSTGRADLALAIFHSMRSPCGGGEHGGSVSSPNSFTMSAAINACAVLADGETGSGVHALVVFLGFMSDVVVSTTLIDMYAKSNRVVDARRVFDGIAKRNVVTWGSMISAYSQNGKGHDALHLFGKFLWMKVAMPNHYMFSSVVSACASLGRLGAGKCLHAAVIRQGYDGNDVIAGALVDMYAKCGYVDQSRKVFERIAWPTVVPYTSMIVAAAKNGLGKLSLGILDEMLDKGVRPNEVTLLGVLYACSHSGLVDEGLEYLHSMSKNYEITPSAKHYACAVDMLGRAGRLDEAYNLSKDFPVPDNNDALLLWTTLLSASRKHGRTDLAAEASKQLVEFNQDAVGAYVVMANAYRSIGHWEDAVLIWNDMKRRGIHKDPGCSWIEIKDVAYVFYAGNVSFYGRRIEILELLKDLDIRMREKGYVGGEGIMPSILDEEESREIMIGMHSERLALAFGLISTPQWMTIRVMKNLRICSDCHEAFKLISDIVGRRFVVRDLSRFHHFSNGSCTCEDYW